MESFINQAKLLSYFIAFADKVTAGVVKPSAKTVSNEVAKVSHLLTINSAWGSDVSSQASIAGKKARKYLSALNELSSLMMIVYKTDSPTDLNTLKAAINRLKEDYVEGAAGNAYVLERLVNNMTMDNDDTEVDHAKRMDALGRQLVLNLADGFDALVAMNPETEVFGEYDAGRREAHNTDLFGYESGANDAPVMVVALGSKYLGARERLLFANNVVADAKLVTVKGSGIFSCTIQTDAVRTVDGANAANYEAHNDALDPYTDVELSNPNATGTQTLRSIGSGAWYLTINVRQPDDEVTDIGLEQQVSSAAGLFKNMAVYIDSFKQTDFGKSSRSSVLDAETELEFEIGSIPLQVVSKTDTKKIDRFLGIIGSYDLWAKSHNANLRGRGVIEVLKSFAVDKLGIAQASVDDTLTGENVWAIDFWLSCKPDTITQNEWRELYEQFYRIVKIMHFGVLSSSKFAAMWGKDKIGIDL